LLPNLSISFNPPYPYSNILYLTYPFLTPTTSLQQPVHISSSTRQQDSPHDPVHPTTPIPSPPPSPPTTHAISTSVLSSIPFDPTSAITSLQTSVQSLIDAQIVTHQCLEEHSFLIWQ